MFCLDEPTTVWILIVDITFGYVEKLELGMTILLTTHYLEEADELANNLAIMDHGEIIAKGSPQS